MKLNTLYDRIINSKEKLALIRLDYVDMSIADELAKHIKVIGVKQQ